MAAAKHPKPSQTIAKPLRAPSSPAQLASLADGRFGETPRVFGTGRGPVQRSCLKGAVRGGYGAKAAGRLSVFPDDPENATVNVKAASRGRRACPVQDPERRRRHALLEPPAYHKTGSGGRDRRRTAGSDGRRALPLLDC